jgi:tripartite-type tricarboxylate transporter receptor subunit TctC
MISLFRLFPVIALFTTVSINRDVAHADQAGDLGGIKNISFFVGTSAGAGYDIYARTAAEFLPRYLPGNPRIIVQYLTGAAGVTLANQVYNIAPSDGSLIAMSPASIVLSELVDTGGIQFHSRELGWIGTLTTMTDVLAVFKSSGVNVIEDAKSKSIVIGAAGKIGNVNIYPSLSNALLGTKFKIVHGYAGGNEINLAMENGEVQGRSNQWDSWKAQRPDWIKDGKLSYLLQFGPKIAELGDVPRLADLVSDPAQRSMVDLVEIIELVGRSIFTSPKISPARLAILRTAFDQTMNDPEYLARMKELGLETSSRKGQELQTDLDRASAITPEIRRQLIETLDLH